MQDVNWWLMALAFLLGLVLSLALMIRRVKREVPEYATLAAGAAGAVGAAKLKGGRGSVDVDADDSATLRVPKIDADADTSAAKPGAVAAGAAAAGAAGGAAAAKFADTSSDETAKIAAVKEEPYGPGSARVAAGAGAPSGYDIKGNEDSMLYHTTDSPSYKQTIAEVWFRDEPSAQAAGFARWDSGKAGAATAIAAIADVPAGPHGPGSAHPGEGGRGPSGWTIKGNEDSMLYHTTDSPSYKRTIAEVWFFDEVTAESAGFTHWSKGRAKSGGPATFAEVPPGPHGPGSAKPNADGSGPEGWTVKGNEDSMLYHSPESNAYNVTVAEVWFRDVPTAEAAGFNRWDSGKSQRGKR